MLLKLAVTLLSCLFSIWIFYPGAFTPDTSDAYSQVLNGVFTDAHPPLFSAIWIVIDLLYKGPAGMLALHLCCYWLGLFLLSEYGYRNLSKSFWWILLPGFWLPIVATFGVVWKDASMLASLSLAAGLLAAAYHFQSKLCLLGVTLALFWCTGVRYNAFITVLPLCALQVGAAYKLYSKPLSRLRLTALAITYSISLLVVHIVLIKTISVTIYPKQRMFAYELVGISVRSGTNTLPSPYDNLTMSDLKSLYSPAGNVKTFWANTWPPHIPTPDAKPTWSSQDHSPLPQSKLKEKLEYASLNSAYNSDLEHQWLNAIWSYPVAYLSHKAELTKYLLGISQKYVCYPYHDTVVWTGDYGYRGPSSGTLRHRVNRLLTKALYTLKDSFVFRGWFYLGLIIFQLLWWYLFLKSHTLKLYSAAVAFPLLGLFNIAFLALITPSCDFRYLIPTLYGSIVFLPCLFGVSRLNQDLN